MPRFDLVLCNQVFEHVPQPFQAAKAIFAMLRPGGLLIFTAPFMERQHLQWDFFRYTAAGARAVMVHAGFKVLTQANFGDSNVGSAYVLGFGSGDISSSYTTSFTQTLFREIDNVSNTPSAWLYTGTGLVARRPRPALAHGTNGTGVR